jgi:hypothetical protein
VRILSKKPGGKAYKELVNERISARAVQYSHHAGHPFVVTGQSETTRIRVELTVEEAEQIAKDVAEFNAGSEQT